MNEQELLQKMVAPGTRRSGKWRDGVIQIHITRACDKSCYACTQGSNLGGKTEFMSPEHFEQAVRSLGFDGSWERTIHNDTQTNRIIAPQGAYFGVVGVFGGNPALSPHFAAYCEILRRLVPFEQRGLWCNNPMTLDKAKLMAATFNPGVSNLNVHLDQTAYIMFKQGWPQCHPVGLHEDSRHSPVHLAMKDVVKKKVLDGWGIGNSATPPEYKGEVDVADDDRIRELISTCDINQHWSAMIGMFRGELRAWFCEVAGAQAMLHQHEPDYPDTGSPLTDNPVTPWWQRPMESFKLQVRKHCFECGVPLRGYGQLAQGDESQVEQTSTTHAGIFRPKRKDRKVEVVTDLVQLGIGKIEHVNHYLQNARV